MNFKVDDGYTIRAENCGLAWIIAKQFVERNGHKVNGTIETRNTQIVVSNPSDRWIPPACGWHEPALTKYAQQLVDPNNPGFEYTYGNRLRSVPFYHEEIIGYLHIDQLNYIIWKLRKDPNSRQAVANLWDAREDGFIRSDNFTYTEFDSEHKPCMVIQDYMIRDGKLCLTAVFRSHDYGRALFENLWGLSRLMEYVAKELSVDVGTLTVISLSAHIYEV